MNLLQNAIEALEWAFEDTGLGLATAQRFAAAHGGRIEHVASSLGGAAFVVRLPLTEVPLKGAA